MKVLHDSSLRKRTPKNSKQKEQTARVENFPLEFSEKKKTFSIQKNVQKFTISWKLATTQKDSNIFTFDDFGKVFLPWCCSCECSSSSGGVSWDAKKDFTSHFSLSLCTMTSLFQDDEKSWFLPSNDRQSRNQNSSFSPSFIVQTTPPVNLSGSSARCSLAWVKYMKAYRVCVCAQCAQKSAIRMKLEFPESCIICWLQKEGRRGWKEAKRSLRESR